jgi:hypothetical protein
MRPDEKPPVSVSILQKEGKLIRLGGSSSPRADSAASPESTPDEQNKPPVICVAIYGAICVICGPIAKAGTRGLRNIGKGCQIRVRAVRGRVDST